MLCHDERDGYDRDVSAVHSDWLARLESAFQHLHHDVTIAEVCDVPRLVRQALESIERPPDRLHHALLAVTAVDFIHHLIRTIHEPSASTGCSCHRSAWSCTDWLTLDSGDLRATFSDWTDSFVAHFNEEHPKRGATLAAALIRTDSARLWRLNDLAARVNVRPSQLREEFATRYGLRVPAYVQLVRATRAIELFATDNKVEAIAREVGYRSKKDLYAALRRWSGCMPAGLRALSSSERSWLLRELRGHCMRGVRLQGT